MREKKQLTNTRIDIEEITKKIRKDILSGVRMPRERLIEQDLSNQYSANRMMIRQSLLNLEKEGLIIIEPYKGASVKSISLETVHENYEIMAMLMGFAAKIATPHMTKNDISKLKKIVKEQEKIDGNQIREWEELNRSFHRTINLNCKNNKLVNMIRQYSQFMSFWFLYLSFPNQMMISLTDHKMIIEALERNNADKTSMLMEKHMINSGRLVADSLKDKLPQGSWI